MNWTGGSLKRHSRRKGWKEDASRQKQYFAKARLRAQQSTIAQSSDAYASPFVPSYIPETSSLSAQAKSISPQPRMRASKSSSCDRLAQLSSDSAIAIAIGIDLDSSPQRLLLGKRDRQGRVGRERSNESEQRDLELKRRKLLEKSDWTGIQFQRPLIVEYEKGSRGGQRAYHMRNDTVHHQQKHQVKVPSRQPHPPHESSYNSSRLELRSKESFRIRIGSQNLRWSRDGNTIKSLGSTDRIATSYKDRNALAFVSSSAHVPSSVSSRDTSSSRSSSCRESRVHRDEQIGPGICVASQQQRFNPHRSSSNDTSTEAPNAPYIVESAPLLYHPRPSRNQRPKLFDIKSPIPDEASSTLVEIGEMTGPQRQDARDDAHWKSWLSLGLSETSPDPQNHHRKEYENMSITPGVSVAWNGPAAPHLQTPSQPGNDSQLSGPPSIARQPSQAFTTDSYATEQGKCSPCILSPCRHESLSSNQDHTPSSRVQRSCDLSTSGTHGTGVRDQALLPNHEPQRYPDAHELVNLPAQEPPADKEADVSPVSGHGSTPGVADDEVWRKFLSDEDGNEITRKALDEAMDTVRRELLHPAEQMASDRAEPPSPASDAVPMTDRGTHGSLSDPLALPMPVTAMDKSTIPSETPTDSVTSGAVGQGSPDLGPEQQHSSETRFHQPRPFVGRLASTGTGARPPRSPVRRRRGRARKRGDDGRPDFRAMPTLEGDPIESEDE